MITNFSSFNEDTELIDSNSIKNFSEELEGYLENYYNAEVALVSL